MSEQKRLSVPRELWRKAMPTAPERVIRALETLSGFYDGSEAEKENIYNDIYLSSGSGTAALSQIQALESAVQDLQLEAALASALPVSQQTQDDEELAKADPQAQAAAMFLANATPVVFTPTIVGLTTAGTGTYTYQHGSGQLIGNRFYFSCSIGWTAHTGTGVMAVAGLPFASLSTANRISAVSIVSDNLSYLGALTAYILPSETQVRMGQLASGSALTGVALDTAAAVHINGFYEV